MNPLTSLLIGSVALMVFGFGIAAAAWEWYRRHPEQAA